MAAAICIKFMRRPKHGLQFTSKQLRQNWWNRLANDGLMQSVERVANDAIDAIGGESMPTIAIGGESGQRCDRRDRWMANDAIDTISGECGQRCDRWRVWLNDAIGGESSHTTRSVERVANDAIDAIGGESGQRRDRWREWPTT